MARRNTRSSYPSPRALLSPPDRSSLPFQYSTARPPTGYSDIETAWSQPSHVGGMIPPASPAPPLPQARASILRRQPAEIFRDVDPFSEPEEVGGDGQSAYTGTLYQRSDWGDGDDDPRTGITRGNSTGSSSSWAGPRSARTSRGGEVLPQIAENETWSPIGPQTTSPLPLTPAVREGPATAEARQRVSSPSSMGGEEGVDVEYAYDQIAIMESPSEMTPAIGASAQYRVSVESGGVAVRDSGRKSTLPSVLDLEQLSKPRTMGQVSPRQVMREATPTNEYDPFADPLIPQNHTVNHKDHRDPSQAYGSKRDRAINPQSDYSSHNAAPNLPSSYFYSHSPGLGSGPSSGNQTDSPKLISPEAQERLGRMSVAPARYSLPPSRKRRMKGGKQKLGRGFGLGLGGSSNEEGTPSQTSNDNSKSHEKTAAPAKRKSLLDRIRSSKIAKLHATYLPFLNPLNTLSSALMLTIATTSGGGSGMSEVVKVGKGVFEISRAGEGRDVGLGVGGWCGFANGTSQCEPYSDGDFATSSGTFLIPGHSSLTNLSSIMTSLLALTWLLATFQIVTAFLHFYLFFALSIPYSHLTTTNDENQNEDKDERTNAKIVAEVNLRVQCERQPYDGYLWVWWAWWAHRRGPVGVIFALLAGSFSIVTFIMVFIFRRAIEDATQSADVHLGKGAYVPLMTFLSTLDPFVEAIKYVLGVQLNFSTFLRPPSPSPTVLLLPASEKKMQHIRPYTNGSSFFAPRQTTVSGQVPSTDRQARRPTANGLPPDTAFPLLSPQTASVPSSELDPETIRWLAAYPHDKELVNLISDLRSGRENDDFLLSEVGLLYLRPTDDAEAALLVPPQGEIRRELIEDAHFDPVPSGSPSSSQSASAHNDLDTMMEVLSQTFWWNGMSKDVRQWLDGCKVCQERKRREVMEQRAGMTAVPWTGVTQGNDTTMGQSAMAAEMAYAIRKAEEEAAEGRLV
ncbi:hypothetical protein CI109_106837 [Kwoniella shandongensis]|uniref:Integrase zinc-binding domain-containing protein n=1 Tax=Kwoniella shandongensis TaxID=1734106 RepID=A0A5M6C6H1_9TREE|nr:uncharacterized protein CI109_000907 [Kwoniella shandongensis]KAA5530727.1 hypothetical protein CI109_000907 [Kwoniella shandongensis]